MDKSQKIVALFKERFDKMSGDEQKEFLNQLGIKYHEKNKDESPALATAKVYLGAKSKRISKNAVEVNEFLNVYKSIANEAVSGSASISTGISRYAKKSAAKKMKFSQKKSVKRNGRIPY